MAISNKRCRILVVFKESKSTRWFFLTTLLCAVFTICAFIRCHSHFVDSQNKIVANQTAQTIAIDSLLTSFREAVKTHSDNKEQIVKQIIADSIIVKLPKLNNVQQKAIQQYLEATLIASTNEMSYATLLKDLEATLATKQLSQIQDDTKSLLELEFNKIQHEYEALALWGGILTIVFLIFSFYSLFKTDQLAQQGQSALEKIDQIRERAEEKASKIDEKALQLINRTEQKLTNNRKDIDGILKKVLADADKEITRAQDEAEKSVQKIKDKEGEFAKHIDKIGVFINESIDKANKDLDAKITTFESDFKSDFENVKSTLADISKLNGLYEKALKDLEDRKDSIFKQNNLSSSQMNDNIVDANKSKENGQ